MCNWVDTKTNDSDIIINSKVRLVRNIETKLFPKSITNNDAQLIVDDVFEIFRNSNEGFKFYKLYESLDTAYEDIGKQVITSELVKNKDKSAYIKDKEETLSILINEDNHIKIQSIMDGLNLKDTFDKVMNIDDMIEEKIVYAFHEEYGYITNSLTNIGTGLKASIMIHLPALTISEGIQSILKGLNQVGMTIRGVYGENTSALGNIYIVSNQITLGVQEEEIISNLENVIENIVYEENKCRDIILNKSKSEVEDNAFRAYGILKYSRLLSYKESLELLSDLRLGVELGLIEFDKMKLNRILISIGDKVMEKNIKGVAAITDIQRERARVVREIMS